MMPEELENLAPHYFQTAKEMDIAIGKQLEEEQQIARTHSK